MSAAVRNSNTSLGTALSFSPNTYQFTTALGYGTTVSADYGTAVGQYAESTASNAVAVGGGARAYGSSSTAVGQQSYASGYAGAAYGLYANASGGNATAIGPNTTASGDASVALGDNVSAPNTNQFSVKMRSSPSGLSGSPVYWDSATNEVYAGSGGGGGGVTQIIAGTGITITSTGPSGTGAVTINASGGGGGPNWATYQDNDMSSISLSLATPSSTASSPYATWFFSGSASPTGSWMYQGMVGSAVGSTYNNNSYPISSPITGGPPFSGYAVCYFPSYQNDTGTASTFQVAVGSSLPSYFSSTIYIGGGWPVFGATRYGHFIAAVQGNWAGAVTAIMSGVTLVDEFYDSSYNNSYFFFDCDSSAVSNMSSGMSIASFGGSTASYHAIFWYNY
jgi:hypothetical protein